MLGHSIALIAVAAMFGIEAYRASNRIPRLILTGFAVAFALAAAFIQPLAQVAPRVMSVITEIVIAPSTWLILAVALFFVLRPIWRPKDRPADQRAEYDDTELREKVEGLAQKVESPDCNLHTRQPDVDEIRKGLEAAEQALTQVADALLARDDLKRVDSEIGPHYPAPILEPPSRPEAYSSAPHPLVSASSTLDVMLSRLGEFVGEEKVSRLAGEAEARVRSDPHLSAILPDDPPGYWESSDMKRMFNIYNAKQQVFERLYHELRQDLMTRAEISRAGLANQLEIARRSVREK